MIKLGRIFLMVVTLCVIACEEPVDLDLPQEEDRLAVVSEFAPDRYFNVVVSNSISSISNTSVGFSAGATVTLFAGDHELEVLQLNRDNIDEDRPPYFTSRNKASEMQGEYRIQVEVPGYPTVSAYDVIPEQTPIKRFRLERLQQRMEGQEEGYDLEMNLEFTPQSDHDFYHLILYYERIFAFPSPPNGQIVETSRESLTLDNVIGNPRHQRHFIQGMLLRADDIDTNDANIKLRTKLGPNRLFQVDHNLIVELRTISEDYYLFHSTFTRHLSQQDSIVGQAVVLHSNVDNGLGTFGAYNYVQDTIHLN